MSCDNWEDVTNWIFGSKMWKKTKDFEKKTVKILNQLIFVKTLKHFFWNLQQKNYKRLDQIN